MESDIRNTYGLEVKNLKKKRRKAKIRNVLLADTAFKNASGHLGSSEAKYVPITLPKLSENSELRKRRPTDHDTRLSIKEEDSIETIRNKYGLMVQNRGVQTFTEERIQEVFSMKESDAIDYVLVYNKRNSEKGVFAKKREAFEKILQQEQFILNRIESDEDVFVTLHCCFARLCKEAEKVKLQMPLKDMDVEDLDNDCSFSEIMERKFTTDNEVDYVSMPFVQKRLHFFKGHANPETFFRSSLRSLLAYHILINLDLRKHAELIGSTATDSLNNKPSKDHLARQGLLYLLLNKVYTDAFVPHDRSAGNPKETSDDIDEHIRSHPAFSSTDDNLGITQDPRHDLNSTWPKIFKFQPLWKIRNYFGEEIAFYFAWMGHLVFSIFIPMLVGIAVFGFGLHCSITGTCASLENVTESTNSTTSSDDGDFELLFSIIEKIRKAFDNDSTPIYTIVICLWSTIFLESWKRRSAVLAYEWDVDNYESTEPDRPEYYGTEEQIDPVTKEKVSVYPFKLKCIKYTVSFGFLLLMVCLVFVILISVIVYRIFVGINYCNKDSTPVCFIVSTICPSLLNAVAMLILGKLYEKMAYWMTSWENHRTQTDYENSLIIKLFAFQFANCYSSLYYIAFFGDYHFIDGVLGLGEWTDDSCGTSCMSELSLQVLILMVAKAVPKFLLDVVLPFVMRILKRCKSKNSVNDLEKELYAKMDVKSKFLITEKNKPPLDRFTLAEYTEKVIQYGFAVLFASAMPLAPLILILLNALDRYVDSKRLLWMYRRPVANITQDIGVWYYILEFMSIAAVVTNAFIIAYISNWGMRTLLTTAWKLGAILIFEHVIFAVKFFIAAVIPDIPSRVKLSMRKEQYIISEALQTGAFVKDLHVKVASPRAS